jgi:hypothetical protein
MRHSSLRGSQVVRLFGLVAVGAAALAACSGTTSSQFADGGGGKDGGGADAPRSLITGGPDGSGGSNGNGGTVAAMCPAGTMCGVTCSGGGTTTVTGKVYDPAGKNPLYGVEVFVPGAPLTPLPGYQQTNGVPMGANSCSCGALYPEGAVVSTTTKVDGTFTLNDVPVGSSVPLVLQVGKWRRSLHIAVTGCMPNAQPDGSLTLPGTVAAGDTDDNMPNIAVSTGSADSLECLLVRIGVSPSEYVAGASTGGHVHIFAGGQNGGGFGGGFGGGAPVGSAEPTPMAGETASHTTLWATPEQLYPYDVVLLSCEGGETYDAVPSNLESYLNAGGRVFASHYHYAWFSGPLGSGQKYSAPADWGPGLAEWNDGSSSSGNENGPIGGIVDQTLNGGGGAFQKGQILDQWLGENGALGTDGEPAGELAIYQPRFNATVTAADKPSQPWITADPQSGMGGSTMYFSFDTPVGASAVCGRAVFSDLHVSGNKANCGGNGGGGPGHHGGGGGGGYSGCDDQTKPPPTSCDDVDLSPQEKALEFMLFDLSACVIPDTTTVTGNQGLPPPPSK